MELIERSNKYKKDVAQKDGYIIKIKEELELIKSKNNAQERELNSLREEHSEVDRSYIAKEKIYKEVDEQKKLGEIEIRAIQNKILDKRNAVGQMKATIEKNKMIIRDFNTKYENLVSELRNIENQNSTVFNTFSRVNQDLSDIKQRVEKSENRYMELKKSVNNTTQEIDNKESLILQLEEEELFLLKKMEALESLIIEKKKRVVAVNDKVEKCLKIVNALKIDVNKKNQDYDLIKKKEASELKNLEHLNYKITQIEAEILGVESDIKKTNDMINNLREKRSIVNTKTKRLSEELVDKNFKLQKVLNSNFVSEDPLEGGDSSPPFFNAGGNIEV
jgi:chromosome segregation ATPase